MTARRWAACLILVAAIGCKRRPETEPEVSAEPKHVRCEPLTLASLATRVELRGTVAPLPDRDAQVAPQVAGRILRVLVREGDAVAEGQELARIDAANLEDQLHQAQAQLDRARAETALAKTTEGRVRRIFDRGIAARQELDDAVAKLATAEAAEADARAAFEIARRAVARAQVRSPLRGVVLKLFRRPGELVDGTPATPVVEVGDPSLLELVTTATASELVALRPAAPAEVRFAALPRAAYGGQVSAVSPAVDRNTGLGVVRVRLTLVTGAPAPPVGISGVASVDAGAPRPTLTAPAAALRASTGTDAELVVCGADGHAHVATVSAGAPREGRVTLLGPNAGPDAGDALLRPGAKVVVDPVLGVADGDAIVEEAR